MTDSRVLSGVSAVAIGSRALMIAGPVGSGKSSLALALIDRGARLIGDDAVLLSRQDGRVMLSPPPNITGMIEIRGVGIAKLPTASAPLALVLDLGECAPRLPQALQVRRYLGIAVPCLGFMADHPASAIRAEHALALHGLKTGQPS